MLGPPPLIEDETLSKTSASWVTNLSLSLIYQNNAEARNTETNTTISRIVLVSLRAVASLCVFLFLIIHKFDNGKRDDCYSNAFALGVLY